MFPQERDIARSTGRSGAGWRRMAVLCCVLQAGMVLPGLGQPTSQTASPPSTPAPVTQLTINGPIGPANADYVVRGISHVENFVDATTLKP